MFERHISNLDNWAINIKGLIIFHRALQNIKVNRKIIKDLSAKSHLLHPYQKKNPDGKYNIKMFVELSKQYSNYVKFYLKVCTNTEIMCKGLKNISNEVRALRTVEILKHYEFFEAMVTQIFDIFQHSNFCKTSRLFSNLIFMCFKDLIKIYKIYYVHITEILERFPSLNSSEAPKALIMYENFVNLTEAIKTKANKLIYTFNFPIQLPDFYNPEKGLVDTLKVVVQSAQDGGAVSEGKLAEVASKARSGMNRDHYSAKDDEEVYFDCNVLEKFDENQHEFDKIDEKKKADTNIDLMDFISKADFTSVGG